MVIAIDGPAASGKSTTARAVARELGYLYVDTGAMYRAVALQFIRRNESWTQEGARRVLGHVHVDLRHTDDGLQVFLNGENVSEAIRTPRVTAASSAIAALPAVREKMVQEQRRMARRYQEQGGGVVLDGRDIGTVVFPDADVKIFMVADEEVRGRRRFEELSERGDSASYDDVLADIRKRDERDARRAMGPLRKAEDAVEMDTSSLSIDEQVRAVMKVVKERQNLSAV